MDAGIGAVIDALKQTGQYEETLIVFTSDNGGHRPSMANNGPYRRGKQSMYEGGLRVPAGVTWPGEIEAATSTERLALTMDIFPTIMDILEIDYNGHLDGRSFLPTLRGKKQPERDQPLYFSRREGGSRYGGLTIQAVRKGDWKLLQNSPFQPQELYNLENDPTEENNVIQQYPDKASELNALMRTFIQRGGSVPWQKTGDN